MKFTVYKIKLNRWQVVLLTLKGYPNLKYSMFKVMNRTQSQCIAHYRRSVENISKEKDSSDANRLNLNRESSPRATLVSDPSYKTLL